MNHDLDMRIAIVGAGGVGGYFGARLIQAGLDVGIVARGEHLAAIARDGLHVECDHEELRARPAWATDHPEGVGPVDAVLVAVKSWQLDGAVRSIEPLLGARTAVVPLLNGVEAPGLLARRLDAAHVLGGLCWTASAVVAPGRIRSIGSRHGVVLGELDGRPGRRASRIAAALRGAGIEADVADDIEAAMWGKLVPAAALGGVGSMADAPAGELRRRADTRRLIEEVMREVVAVAHARGIALRSSLVAEQMARLDALPAEVTSSLQRDILSGRPSELEARVGVVVRLGREAGVPTPAASLVYETLLPLELRAGSGSATG